MGHVPLTIRRWSRQEYERLVDLGAFAGDPVELIDGELYVAEPQGTYHITFIGIVGDAIRVALPAGWIVRIQGPLALDEASAPEPDVAVVRGAHADYMLAHPTAPALVVEVADSSLGFDRDAKGSLYARARVPDYWIVNVVDRLIEVYRDPVPDPSARFGWRYASRTHHVAPDVISLLAVPSASVAVATLLPSVPTT